MDVILKAIQFNHNCTAATHDAFNIRFNETQAVELPEWRRGITFTPQQSPAAYAINETRGNTLTLKASFAGTAESEIFVRAVQARPDSRQARGCNPFGWLSSGAQSFGVHRANVLGEVKERRITLDAKGKAELEEFELDNVLVWTAGISVSNTEWRWQFRATRRDRWTDFAITKHRIYTVLEIPNCPWQQFPFSERNTQLPWAEALEYACDWAVGAQEADQAAALITSNIYDLGLSHVGYFDSSFYSCPNFNCTGFLKLLNGELLTPHVMNCSDCATVVSSFANLVGCNLMQIKLGPAKFTTNLIRLIGDLHETTPEFSFHEVAWKGEVTDDGRIFDGCLQVDGDPQPGELPFEPLLPRNLRFGSAIDHEYRFRLAAQVFPRPDTLICRPIGFSELGLCGQADDELKEFLKQHYQFESWRKLPPNKRLLSGSLSYLQLLFLSEWTLGSWVDLPSFQASVLGFQTLWVPLVVSDALVRLDFFELPDWQEARNFLLLELGEFELLKLRRLTKPLIGDVSFANDDYTALLFAQEKFVVTARSAGRTPVDVLKVATTAENHLLQLAIE